VSHDSTCAMLRVSSEDPLMPTGAPNDWETIVTASGHREGCRVRPARRPTFVP
jgi:hypothetical protein